MKKDFIGRVTIPTDVDVVPETLELLKRWGADAIRDCDGTDYPDELKNVEAKVYSTYYTTRKDNAWAKANPDEIQQMYIMTPFYTAVKDELSIHLMKSERQGRYQALVGSNRQNHRSACSGIFLGVQQPDRGCDHPRSKRIP